jgi:hypothetical protein
MFIPARFLALLLMPSVPVLAQFTFTPFDVPGSAATYPRVVNNNGDIAGTFTDTSGNTHGFIRSANGIFTTFDPCNGVCSNPFSIAGINDLGQVAGVTQNGGFVRDQAGNFTAFIGPDGSTIYYAIGFTNAGETIGVSIVQADIPLYYLLTVAGGYTIFGTGLGTFIVPSYTGINNNGQISGNYLLNGGINLDYTDTTGGLIENLATGQITDFNYSPLNTFSHGTLAVALNDSGQVLGQYADGINIDQPSSTLLGPSQYTSLSFQNVDFIRSADGSSFQSFVPPFLQPVPVGLNQSGEVVGSYTDSAGSHGFLAAPLADTVPPVVSVLTIVPGPPEQVVFSVVDPGSGIFNIIPVPAVNCTVVVDPFTPGQTTPVTVTATKTDQSQSADVAMQVTDMAGNVTVYAGVAGKSDVISDVPASEHILTVTNGKLGLEELLIGVNGKTLVVRLRNNESRTLNLSSLMTRTSNSVSLEGRGPENAQASVLLK